MDLSSPDRSSSKEWQDIFEAIGHPAVILAPDHKVIAANRASIKLTGKQPREIIGRYCYEIFHDQYATKPVEGCPMEKMLMSGRLETTEMELEASGGTFLVSCTPVLDEQGKLEKVIHIATDITSQKKAEKERVEREQSFSALVEQSLTGIALIQEGVFVYVNPHLTEMIGYRPEDMLGQSPLVFVVEADRELVRDSMYKRLSGEMPSAHFTFRALHRDGSEIDIELHSNSIMYRGSRAVLSTLLNITERKKAEKIIVESEQKYRELFDSATDAIFILDLKGHFIDVNRTAYMRLGYTKDEMLALHISKLDPPEFAARVPERLALIQEHGQAVFESAHLRKDGSAMPVEVNSRLLDYEGRKVYFSVIRDITERKKLEEQLRHSQKLDGIGQLAGGIAHDFNNLLSAVIGFGGILQMRMDDSNPLKHYVDEIVAAGQRGAALTRQILAFSRKQAMDMKPVNLTDIVKNLEKMLYRLIREDIKLRLDLYDKELIVIADASQLEQVLINLVTNAKDAIEDSGEIILQTMRASMDEEFVRAHGFGAKGEYAVLMVSDSGAGMDKETVEKIFEPFFTTKEQGKGTGLGLSVAYGIVKKHDGFINIYSEEGKGTTVKIYLPVSIEKAEKDYEKMEETAVNGGTETVLVAEDDAAIRILQKTVLSEFGYKVIEAADGEDAVMKFIQNKDRIKLVILDGIMPKKNGKEAYDEIRLISPDIKTIFMSGYSEDIFSLKDLQKAGVLFLQKPASPTALLKKIREALNA